MVFLVETFPFFFVMSSKSSESSHTSTLFMAMHTCVSPCHVLLILQVNMSILCIFFFLSFFSSLSTIDTIICITQMHNRRGYIYIYSCKQT